MEIVIATANRHKLEEIRTLLGGIDVPLLSLHDLATPPSLPEEGKTYLENAAHKATTVFRLTGKVAIGEDSGLEVDALGGGPGLLSRRFGGGRLTDSQRNALLLEHLKDVPPANRTARFRCVVALVDSAGRMRSFEGTCEGLIATSPRGSEGFGYDPIFLVPRYGKTMAELGLKIKNRISHRARAFAKVKTYLAGKVAAPPAQEPPPRN